MPGAISAGEGHLDLHVGHMVVTCLPDPCSTKLTYLCQRGDSNPYSRCRELDFESSASTNSATLASHNAGSFCPRKPAECAVQHAHTPDQMLRLSEQSGCTLLQSTLDCAIEDTEVKRRWQVTEKHTPTSEILEPGHCYPGCARSARPSAAISSRATSCSDQTPLSADGRNTRRLREKKRQTSLRKLPRLSSHSPTLLHRDQAYRTRST